MRGPRGAVVGASVGGALAVGVVVLLAATFGAVAVAVAAVLALVPLGALTLTVRWVDRWEPEPRSALLFALAWGAGVAVLVALVLNTASSVALVVSGLDETSAAALTASVVAPVVEESVKGLGVLVVFWCWRRHVDGPVDGIVYAATVATGFAVVEDVLYLAHAFEGGGAEVAAVFALRALFSPFAHLMFTAPVGLAVGVAARRGEASWLWRAPLGWLLAVALHALWNGSATLGGGELFLALYVLVQVPLFVGAVVLVLWLRRQEGRAVAEALAPFAAHGWFTAADLQMLSSMSARSRALQWARGVGGPAGEAALREFQEAATALAYQRHRVLHRRVGTEGLVDEQVLAARAARARGRVRDLLAV